ncbi:MAG TPA: DUF2127 domain-containing protein [Methylophilaceae bacterium]|jgi:uncharacterized membrane protein (DUF2068 family)
MSSKAERIIAVFEAAKGALILVAGFGLLELLHRQARQLAEKLVQHLHLNPSNYYSHIFLDLADNINNGQLWALAVLIIAYATIRFLEAYGLWNGRRWAEWLAAASGGIYVPLEIYELISHPSWLKLLTLVLNLSIVIYMGYRLMFKRLD